MEDIQQLINENNKLSLEKCQWEKEKNCVQEKNNELVFQNNSLQTDLRAKECQVHELETSLTKVQQALEDMQQLKDEHNRLKLEKCQLEKEKNDVREEKDEPVVQNNSLQTDLRAKEAQVHELETSVTKAQQALEDMQQLKITHDRLKLEKCLLEKEKNDVQEEKDELVVQNISFQTDLRAKEARVHELETSLTTALQALEDMQQLNIKYKRLKLEKYKLEKEKNDVQEEKDELVVENNSLQTDLRAKEAQVHRLETSAQSVEGWSKVNIAFDTVDHNILHLCGIHGVINKCLDCSYLTGRFQTTQTETKIWKKEAVACGIPQGSVLGWLLFLLYINDILASSCKVEFLLFADDTNHLCKDNKSLPLLESVVNEELINVCDWLLANQLSLNAKKSNYAIFHPYQRKIQSCSYKSKCI